MTKDKEIWEYPTITEVVYKLVKEEIDEEKRHLAIGVGVVLGAREAHKWQNREGTKGYWANAIRDQSEEAGLIAENISQIVGVDGETLDGLVREVERGGEMRGGRINRSWARPYGIVGKQAYSEEGLEKLGAYLEKRFQVKSNQRDFKEFKNKMRRLSEKVELKKGFEKSEAFMNQRLEVGRQIEKGKRLLEEKGLLTRYLIEFYK